MASLLGSRIERLRKENGLTQTGLALEMGESQATVSKWEAGKTRPSISKLPKLANRLGTTVDYLLSLDAESTAC